MRFCANCAAPITGHMHRLVAVTISRVDGLYPYRVTMVCSVRCAEAHDKARPGKAQAWRYRAAPSGVV